MHLYEEIFKSVDGAAMSRCIIVPNGGGYFEGVKGVEDFSSERIVLRFSQGLAAIEGRALFIKKYCDGDLEIAGRIFTFSLLEAEEATHSPRPSQNQPQNPSRKGEKG